MTAVQMRRAAREARKLASLIVEGRAPEMDPGDWTLCACGWVARKAGIHRSPSTEPAGWRVEYAAWPGTYFGPVSSGLSRYGPPGAVFPLLWMADALDAAARRAHAHA